MSEEKKVRDHQRMSKEEKMRKEDEIMTFFIQIAYRLMGLKSTIFSKISFLMKNTSIKTYSINIKYTIFRC